VPRVWEFKIPGQSNLTLYSVANGLSPLQHLCLYSCLRCLCTMIQR